MARTKTASSGEDTRAPKGDRLGQRARTASYRKSKELGRKANDLDEGSIAQASHVQGGSCLFTGPHSSGRIFFIGFKRKRKGTNMSTAGCGCYDDMEGVDPR
ncbi:hypothetical protein Scep_019294 [Stephania cephalantha]|uniref:Uncharacterized protein n=1 Tax=Stephania cephalantha TaxID=152367 RepID=A0AAP0NN54_9MAGN